MYEPYAFLATVDRNAVPILLICAGSMLANYTLFIESFRVSRRRRMVTMPVFCTMFWLAHDASYVAQYTKWFDGYDHWYTKLFWVALVLTVAWELAFSWQLIAYGRDEFAPFLSQKQWVAAVVAAELLALGTWLAVKAALNDPLYVWTFGVALVAYPIFGLATMAKRRSTVGFTPLQPAALTVMCLTWFTASIGWFGPGFRSWPWLLLAALSIGSAGFMTWLAVRYREPAAAPAGQTSAAASSARRGPDPRVAAG
jgi:hypothetical protein